MERGEKLTYFQCTLNNCLWCIACVVIVVLNVRLYQKHSTALLSQHFSIVFEKKVRYNTKKMLKFDFDTLHFNFFYLWREMRIITTNTGTDGNILYLQCMSRDHQN